MTKNLIYGKINPLHIMSIEVRPFKRFGRHSYYHRLYKKKHPILYRMFAPEDNGWSIPSSVIIRGKDRVILEIECRSKDHAKSLCDQLNKDLDDFLGNLMVMLKLQQEL